MKLLTVFFLWVTAICAKANVVPSKSHIGGRIVGGQVAGPDEFFFIAAIDVTTADSTFFCAGSVISLHHVLTTGYCVDGGVNFKVTMGSNQLQGTDENRRVRTSKEYIIHPYYDSDTLEHNLGFVYFYTELEVVLGHLSPVNNYPISELEPGSEVMVAGWGQTSDAVSELPNDLYFVNLTVINNYQCRFTYGSQITADMICALGISNQGTCIGDIGGPLVTEVTGIYKRIHAVATFVSGNGCENDHPSGFTSLYPHWDWIKEVTGIEQ